MSPTSHENGKLLAWGSDIEPATIEQAARTSRLPFVEGHVALMPDAHVGIGATVGSVIPTQGAIIPAAVGVDIGCGMIAVETPVHASALPDSLDRLHGHIAKVVPSGVGKGHEVGQRPGMPSDLVAYAMSHFDYRTNLCDTAFRQYGTLGSGNHFVEVCLDERDRVWIVLHSGSRGIGNKLATQHIESARGLMKRYFIDLEDRDLAYLVEGTPEFDAYIQDMLWSQDYARGNRDAMMDAVLIQFKGFLGWDFDELRRVNCHHNFTQKEHHRGRNIWVTRKGAIKADKGDEGVIPGSMGTRSYIVSGLGNPASFNSCSHGAGRRLSRGAARKQLTVDSLRDAMKGRAWNETQAEALLDEHPDSYKDVDQVMADQADLVEIQHTLHQILNYKGTS